MVHLAVVTGGKAHDVIGFQQLFNDLPGICSYIQHIDDFAATDPDTRETYDAVLFYLMMLDDPVDEGLPRYCGQPRLAIGQLGENGQGIVILHHALLAYPQWSVWSDMVGLTNRSLEKYHYGQVIPIDIADPSHPITRDLLPWVLSDETYLMANADGDNQVLLTTDHEKSMQTIAWVRQYKNSRVFCLQPGHDRQAWENESFRRVLQRGIQWSCGKRKIPAV